MPCRTAGVPGEGHNSHGASPFLSWQIRVFRQPPCRQRGRRPVFPMGLLLPSVEYLCQTAPGAQPGSPRTLTQVALAVRKGKGACQGTFSEFTHVTILNFAASGNSRSRKRSSAQFFRHQAGAAFQNHDSPGCENGLYTNVGSSSGSFSFTELTFLKMLTTGDCF